MAETRRTLYQGAYRNELEDDNPTDVPVNQDVDTNDTTNVGLSPEELTWKKRYADLRSHSTQLTERISSLENQLRSATKKEMVIPSSPDEIAAFANKYPDTYRHIRSIAMAELLQERENIVNETKVVKEDLDKIKREAGLTRILQAHPDFYEVDNSLEFKEWLQLQPRQIQDWLLESDDSMLCIKGLDLYKAEKGFKAKRVTKTSSGADTMVRTRSSVETDTGAKRVWKESEIKRMHWRDYEKFEDEIELARREGRIELGA